MTHWRTSRQLVGGNQAGGSPLAQDTQRDPSRLPAGSILAPRSPFELGDVSQSLLDEREVRSCLFFCAFLGAVGAFLLISYCALVSLIPQPVEYQIGMKADRLESHR